jgi:hypothetical protein
VLLARGVVCVAASVDASESEEFTDCETRERDTEADAGDEDEERDDDGHAAELIAKAVPDYFRANAPKKRRCAGWASHFWRVAYAVVSRSCGWRGEFRVLD